MSILLTSYMSQCVDSAWFGISELTLKLVLEHTAWIVVIGLNPSMHEEVSIKST